MVVGTGVAGPQHHEEEANRYRDFKYRLQEHSLTQPHKGCCWLLQERHTAWRKRIADSSGQRRVVKASLERGSGAFMHSRESCALQRNLNLQGPYSFMCLYIITIYQQVEIKGIK
jgi:hypothetical protein